MRPALQHAARSLTDHAVLTFFAARPVPAPLSPAVCFQCKLRAFSAVPSARSERRLSSFVRQWSSTARRLQEKPPPAPQHPQSPGIDDAAKPPAEPTTQQSPEINDAAKPTQQPSPNEQEPLSAAESLPPSPPPQNERIEQVPDEKLPSHRQGLRWEIYKRASAYFDELLPKLILVGQKVNSYTGTDFSGIEALRQEIKQQERLVKSRRVQVEEAKRQLEAAQSQQQTSQKEVVGLLERKHSWAAGDLERYMSLIRSEHLNDQAVRGAKDAVMSADRALEEARAHLEKRERAQYHEEQIWSDTIRRNSTWVTIGLMGVNILLLLSQLVAIEPWRRRRLVREIRTALDERTMTAAAPAALVTDVGVTEADLPSTPVPVHADEKATEAAAPAEAIAPASVEKEIDSVIEPAGVPLERVERVETPATEHVEAAETPVTERVEAVEAPVTVSADLSGPEPTIPLPEAVAPEPTPLPRARPVPKNGQERLAAFAEDCEIYVRDLFSERAISIRKIDVTTAALQGAAAGAAFVGLVVLTFLRSD